MLTKFPKFLVIGASASYVLLAGGCSSLITQSFDPNIVYKHDVELTVNDTKGQGLVLVHEAPSYQIKAETKSEFDYVILRTCHREDRLEQEGSSFKYTYTPNTVELDKACHMTIHGFDKDNRMHSFGQIEINTHKRLLPATLDCNGIKRDFLGESVCMSADQLIQRITFPVPTIAKGIEARCDIPIPEDKMHYEFHMPTGKCVVMFQEVFLPVRAHRLSMIGYQQAVVFEEGD